MARVSTAPTSAEIDTLGQAGDMMFGVQPQTFEKDDLDSALEQDMAAAQRGKAGESMVPGASGKAGQLLDLARSQLGLPYKYGSKAWGSSLDCSGLTQQAYARIGIQIGGDTYTQVQQGSPVADIGSAQPGDLVFSVGDVGMRVNGHVGIYIGNGQMIVAPHTGAQVRIQAVPNNITAIRRYL